MSSFIRAVPIAVLLCSHLSSAHESAFVGQNWSTTTTKASSIRLHSKGNDDNGDMLSRRSTLGNMLKLGYSTLSLATIAKPSPSGATDSQGLDASTLDEPSIPYATFLKELDKGNVKSVEFFAPEGNRAYVVFKAIEGESPESPPIRIGEGYPIEVSRGISSPAFVVKAVQAKNVPYKFTLPALANYK